MADTNIEPKKTSSRWFLVPILLLGSLLCMLLVLIAISTSDPGFAVEEDYYRKATHWDEKMQQDVVNRDLGWRAEIRFEWGSTKEPRLLVQLLGSDGQALEGAQVRAELFHNARAADVQRPALTEAKPGHYSSALPSSRPGVWEVRIDAQRAGARFTDTQRVEMPPHERVLRASGNR